jgi:hypothetical protein
MRDIRSVGYRQHAIMALEEYFITFQYEKSVVRSTIRWDVYSDILPAFFFLLWPLFFYLHLIIHLNQNSS